MVMSVSFAWGDYTIDWGAGRLGHFFTTEYTELCEGTEGLDLDHKGAMGVKEVQGRLAVILIHFVKY